jgi:hypothetical protein
METQDNKGKEQYANRGSDRNAHAANVLRKLDALGAIKLDVLVSKASEIKEIVSSGGGSSVALDEWENICYQFMVRVGPRLDIDIVSVAKELRQLGFEVTRMNNG